ncbi:hypothetical protein GYMLUDRAFT_945338 [Collybiopsis luxurians FD-317 M1]|uniref:Uncharacterized protein n=1 Tax=Collybiopsis luxurians FD-317 M1 TaxID=944289 RepID=A0A0D0ARG6_9AGAR|nr:hypothetical protein GYMLUDRAFT_945338 [Collybiopsis luxurians FD-317 M1]
MIHIKTPVPFPLSFNSSWSHSINRSKQVLRARISLFSTLSFAKLVLFSKRNEIMKCASASVFVFATIATLAVQSYGAAIPNSNGVQARSLNVNSWPVVEGHDGDLQARRGADTPDTSSSSSLSSDAPSHPNHPHLGAAKDKVEQNLGIAKENLGAAKDKVGQKLDSAKKHIKDHYHKYNDKVQGYLNPNGGSSSGSVSGGSTTKVGGEGGLSKQKSNTGDASSIRTQHSQGGAGAKGDSLAPPSENVDSASVKSGRTRASSNTASSAAAQVAAKQAHDSMDAARKTAEIAANNAASGSFSGVNLGPAKMGGI